MVELDSIVRGDHVLTVNDIANDINKNFPGRNIFLTPADTPEWIVIPEGWGSFGLYPDLLPNFPEAWNPYREELPLLLEVFERSLLGTALLVGERMELLYIFHDATSLCYYLGGQPADKSNPGNSLLNMVPDELKDYYFRVHDGFAFFPAQSMGPQRAQDFVRISELVDEEDVTFAEKWLTVFSNGGGDYIVVDIGNPRIDEGLIWWHEKPFEPDTDFDIFELMDAWMAIFLEDAKARDELLS